MTSAQAVQAFDRWLDTMPILIADARRELHGKNLACWCALDAPCHADVWLRRVNE